MRIILICTLEHTTGFFIAHSGVFLRANIKMSAPMTVIILFSMLSIKLKFIRNIDILNNIRLSRRIISLNLIRRSVPNLNNFDFRQTSPRF